MVTLETIKLSIIAEKEYKQKPNSTKSAKIPINLASPWKILIVDDEIGIHEMTKLALNNFTFKKKNLTFLSAYSVQDAKLIIKTHPDIALMFLDGIMETDHSGFEVIEYVRKVLKNQLVRIVMRAGKSKIRREDLVTLNYDINDYKVKTELTVEKLSIVALNALRSYQHKATRQ